MFPWKYFNYSIGSMQLLLNWYKKIIDFIKTYEGATDTQPAIRKRMPKAEANKTRKMKNEKSRKERVL